MAILLRLTGPSSPPNRASLQSSTLGLAARLDARSLRTGPAPGGEQRQASQGCRRSPRATGEVEDLRRMVTVLEEELRNAKLGRCGWLRLLMLVYHAELARLDAAI